MTYTTAILADNPVAYYRMDELSGDIAHDLSGNQYHASLHEQSFNQMGAIGGGDNDTAMSFTGAGTLAFPPSLNYTLFSAYSLEYWIQLSSVWHYIVVTATGSSCLLYVDSELTMASGSASLEVGGLLDYAGSPLAGSLDEVALYNYVLSPTQITAHYRLALHNDNRIVFPIHFYKQEAAHSAYAGTGGMVPLYIPSSVYSINGQLLDLPHVATAPISSPTGILPAQSVFFLLFAQPSSLTQTLLINGFIATMSFALTGGTIVAGRVLLRVSQGSLWQVSCITLEPIPIKTTV